MIKLFIAQNRLGIQEPTVQSPIKLTALPFGTTRINYSADQNVTSDLSFTSELKIVYDNMEKRYITVNGSMKSGTKSSYILISPPIIDGAIVETVLVTSSTVSPASDELHTYYFPE